MSQVKSKFVINTGLICIKCQHIEGVCTCEGPKYITIQEYLEIDRNFRRLWEAKYLNTDKSIK
jgi:hypothetical protein